VAASTVVKQKVHVGMIHARKTVTVTADSNHFTIVADGETLAVVPRTTASEINRYKAYATQKHLGHGKDQADQATDRRAARIEARPFGQVIWLQLS
jgi:hypothetical protein